MNEHPVETINDHLVGVTGLNKIVMALPPVVPMSIDEALRMAAWIVAIVDDDERFDSVLAAVRST